MDAVLKANSFALDYLPDLTIYIDVEPKVALKRMENIDRLGKKDRLDSEGIKFHEMVYKGYQEVIKMYPDRIMVVDGNQSLTDVIYDVKKIIYDYLEGLNGR